LIESILGILRENRLAVGRAHRNGAADRAAAGICGSRCAASLIAVLSNGKIRQGERLGL
jgi:hypothetical protein